MKYSTYVWPCLALLCALGLVGLSGCGGGDGSDTTAQAPSAPTPPPAPSSRPEESDETEGYGSEDYEADSGRGSSSANSGGGGGGMDDYYASQMANYGDEGDEEDMYGDMYGGYSGGGGGASQDDMYGAMYGGGYGGDMAGVGGPGMGMGGMGSANPSSAQLAGVTQFVRQNCLACHGPRQTKGGVRLDTLNANLEDPQNVQQYQMIVDVLEAGTMPPPEARAVDPAQKEQIVALIRESLDASGALDRSYWDQAQYAFSVGREQQAAEFLHAHAIVSDGDEAQKVFDKVRWFAQGPKPTTTLRFAVGAIVDAPSTLEDLKPIGSSQLGGAGGGGGGGMYGGGLGGRGGRGRGGESSRDRSFNELTGEFGSAMVAAFETRWAAGDLGSVFNEVVARQPSTTTNQGGMGRGFGAGPGMGGPGYGGEAMYGADYGGYSGGYGGDSGESTAETASLRDNIRAGEVITPGLIFVGTGSQAELLERAAQEGVDAIFVFDIEASQNTRRNVVNNKTRLRVVQTSGNAVAATSSLMNTEVERARMRGTEDDLQKNIDRFFTMFDESFSLTSLPPLNAGHAQNRVQQLLAKRESLDEDEESSMDLQVMFESRLFHSMGLLTDEQLSTVYQIVLEGNEGISLSTGSEADRKLVLGDLLASKG